ncbi:MAG TPA: hypothetical protein PLI42_03310 [Candidatus Pacearchaeota archaeon]|nr:hypothetical protein [Bacteroidales bacterium]HOS12996.1 hypothetical protein [Candidatus Pacearchaeota archaeon]
MKLFTLNKYEKDFIQELSVFSGKTRSEVKEFLLFWFISSMEKLLSSKEGEEKIIKVPFMGDVKLHIKPVLKQGIQDLDVSGEFVPSVLFLECLNEIDQTNQLSLISEFFNLRIKNELNDIIQY